MKPATPGTIMTLAASVLLALASFSTPLLKNFYFLSATLNSSSLTGTLTLGTLGYCLVEDGTRTCSSASVGYNLDLNTILNETAITIPTVVSKWITYVLVLHIVAFGLSFVAFLLGLLAHIREFAMMCFSSIFASLAASVGLIAFVFDLVLFLVLKSRIKSISGASANLGNAFYITLAAWVVLFLSGCAYGCGRRCISSRGPRAPGGGARGDRMKMDDSFNDLMREEAVRDEEDRKRRQAAGGGGLPGFQPFEATPLTAKEPEQWLEEEDVGMSTPYHEPQHSGRMASGTSYGAYGQPINPYESGYGNGGTYNDPYMPTSQPYTSDYGYAAPATAAAGAYGAINSNPYNYRAYGQHDEYGKPLSPTGSQGDGHQQLPTQYNDYQQQQQQQSYEYGLQQQQQQYSQAMSPPPQQGFPQPMSPPLRSLNSQPMSPPPLQQSSQHSSYLLPNSISSDVYGGMAPPSPQPEMHTQTSGDYGYTPNPSIAQPRPLPPQPSPVMPGGLGASSSSAATVPSDAPPGYSGGPPAGMDTREKMGYDARR